MFTFFVFCAFWAIFMIVVAVAWAMVRLGDTTWRK